MADFFQNLDPASAFNLNPSSQPVVSHPDPATLDAGLQHLAELGVQVGLPLGLGAIGGPMSLGLRTLGPAITQAIFGPLEKPRTDRLMMGVAFPNPEQAEVTAARVLAEAASKNGPSYAQWQAKNPGAEEGMFDFKGAQPAMEDRAPVPRYNPPRGVTDRMNDALEDPQVAKALKAAVQKGIEVLPDSWYRTGPLYGVFKQELGDQAPQAYERFMQTVAATSPRNRVPDNVRTASYYYHLDQTGQPIPDKPAPGYGSVAQKLHRQNVINVQNGGMDPLQNPKPTSFVENLLGNETPVTIDTHNFRMLGMASKDPRFLATSVEGSDLNPRKAFTEGKLTMDEAPTKLTNSSRPRRWG